MLSVRDLTKLFGDRSDSRAGGVRDFSFELPQGTFFTLLGPSGCGKTTTLRCVAGLERPDSGRISTGETVLHDSATGESVPLNRRGIGMVFQSYAIWPHMTVFENIAFPLRVAKDRRYAREDIRRMVEDALATVGLTGFGERPATRLSGGQQQRVALARAIVHKPGILLLDEPLSNLDAALREEMRIELRRLQQQIGLTTVYVTHDQAEALAMSDRIAVMELGRVAQMDAPRALYFRPASAFVARFIGAANLLPALCEAGTAPGASGAARLDTGERILCLFPSGATACQTVTIALRPESIALTPEMGGRIVTPDGENGFNRLTGVIAASSFLGGSARHDVLVHQRILRVTAPPDLVLDPGQAVTLGFPVDAAVAVK